jgi:gamma-glutamyl:cysteine ligase YbdK (ATP-grasp superfamily)
VGNVTPSYQRRSSSQVSDVLSWEHGTVTVTNPEQFKASLLNYLALLGHRIDSIGPTTIESKIGAVNIMIHLHEPVYSAVTHGFGISYDIRVLPAGSELNARSVVLGWALLAGLISSLALLITGFHIDLGVLAAIAILSVFPCLWVIAHLGPSQVDQAKLDLVLVEVRDSVNRAAETVTVWYHPLKAPADLPRIATKGVFSHGIEREYAVVNEKGEMPRTGAESKDAFEGIVSVVPEYYRTKEVDGRSFFLIWRDESYYTLLETATRVCYNLVDLEKELTHLVTLAMESAQKAGYCLLGTGAHPFYTPNRNEYFSEHHHIGAEHDDEKVWIYNMIRNFTPELIALTVNSPIFEGHRHRLKSVRMDPNENTNVGPTEGVPYLDSYDRGSAGSQTKKPDVRLMDVTPFSGHPTVEVRLMDNQMSISRSIALAAVLEALALKAKRLLEKGEPVPKVSQEVIAKNRYQAMRFGLSAPFALDKAVVLVYHGSEKSQVRAYEAVTGLLRYIQQELSEIGANNEHLIPLMASVELARTGSDAGEERGTLADWQLRKFKDCAGERKFLRTLIMATANPSIDPVSNEVITSNAEIPPIIREKTVQESQESDRKKPTFPRHCPKCGEPIGREGRPCKKCGTVIPRRQ